MKEGLERKKFKCNPLKERVKKKNECLKKNKQNVWKNAQINELNRAKEIQMKLNNEWVSKE